MLAERALATTSRHCQMLLPAIRDLCKETGWEPEMLDQIYVSAGPGSFTGLRIAVTVVKALAGALGAKVVSVPTLHVVAARALALETPPPNLVVALDAKRGQVYGAIFRHTGAEYLAELDACLLTPAELLARASRPVHLTGEGLAYHARGFQVPDAPWLPEELRFPRAVEVHRIGWRLAQQGCFADVERLLPIYIRIPEAEERWQARQV